MNLSWGWNPVIFFIVLAVSLLFVRYSKKWQVVWVLPAFVLYFGLDWELPSPWSGLFKLGFWLAVVVALVTTFLPGKTELAKASLTLISAVIVVLLAVSGWQSADNFFNNGNDDHASIGAVIPTVGTSTTDCPAQFVQKDITDPKLNRFVKGGIDAKTALKSSDKLLSVVGNDASSLKFYARTFNMKDIPSEDDMLTADKTCLSEAGQQVQHDLKVVMNASGQKFVKAPKNAHNTGVDSNGNPVVDNTAGIRGNLKAVQYTLADGTKVIIMVRCGNPVFSSPPKGVPHGPTDNPPKHHPKCPPGQVGTPPHCLTPKSGNAKDYPYPTGKPKSTASGSGDSTPPKVETSHSGGGGVVDSPTKPPGSETGGQAGGGATKPNPTRTPPPPEAGGGTNDGTVEP